MGRQTNRTEITLLVLLVTQLNDPTCREVASAAGSFLNFFTSISKTTF
jgi:hypothetical protein